MTVSYQWGPEDRAWKVLRDVFALPVKDLPALGRSATTFAGRNPLKWMLVVLGAVGYLLGVLVYWALALFPLVSYLFLWTLALPLVAAVYAVRAGATLVHRGDREVPVVDERLRPGPAPTAAAATRPPRGSTPRPGTSPS